MGTDIVARTLYGEARGEGKQGMRAVGNVIMNRAAIADTYMEQHSKTHPLFGDGTPESACQVPWQFSCWNKNDPNRATIENVTPVDPVFNDALSIASSVINGILDDITNGATHYYDRRMPTPPSWADSKDPCASIGHHLFFNNIH